MKFEILGVFLKFMSYPKAKKKKSLDSIDEIKNILIFGIKSFLKGK